MTHTPHATAPPHTVVGIINTDAIRGALGQIDDPNLRARVADLANGYDDQRALVMHQHEYLSNLRTHLVGVQAIIDRWVAEEEGL